jgi:hypothetical protein
VAVHSRLFSASAHLHHFSPEDIIALLGKAGFQDTQSRAVPGREDVAVFEALRP